MNVSLPVWINTKFSGFNNWLRSLKFFCFLLAWLICLGTPSSAIDQDTLKMLKELKAAGYSEETILEILRLEFEKARCQEAPFEAVGVKDISGPNGGYILYYSVSTPEERKAQKWREEYEYQKSWEIPEHIILDRR